jgi:hypothetical protein
MKFTYCGLVFCDYMGFTTEKSTLSKTQKPKINGTIHFDQPALKTDINLYRTNDPIIRSLYIDSDGNELIWNCHHPRALAEILYNGTLYTGFGYAETLSTHIKPWNLPIDELKWGRFLSDSDTLIWINWTGKYPLNKIFFNGTEYNDAIFANDTISFCNDIYLLKFLEIQLIRKGRVSKLFQKMKMLKILFNHRILNSLEIKYKSKTSLSKNSIILSDGWSLFETVTWEK